MRMKSGGVFRAFVGCLAFLLCGALCGCGASEPVEEENHTMTAWPTQNETQPSSTPEEPMPTSVTVRYLPSELKTRINDLFKSLLQSGNGVMLTPFETQYAPYAIQDVFELSDCMIKSISIPICQVLQPDGDGNFRLTVFVVKNTLDGLKQAPLRSYTVLVNQNAYGLPEKHYVGEMIDVDVSALGIELSADETLAFYQAGDTIIPGYLECDGNEARLLLTERFPQIVGCFRSVGTETLTFYFYTLPFDFSYEYATDSARSRFHYVEAWEEYDTLVAKVKEKYKGKYVSVLGDSISTYGGVSDNPAANRVTGSNPYYWSDGRRMIRSDFTYWGRLIRDTEMKLCVNNAWGGSKVFGGGAYQAEASWYRGQFLYNENGTPNDPSDDIQPDVILFYMGINDIGGTPFGMLSEKLKKAERDQWNAVVEEWFASLMTKTANGTNLGTVGGSTFTSLDEAYALAVWKMKQCYPNAEICCFTLVPNAALSDLSIQSANRFITALSEYFGATTVDLYGLSGITAENCHSLTDDIRAIHPNAAGFLRMTKAVLASLVTDEE